MMYFIASFVMLSWEASMRVFRSQYFIGNVPFSIHYRECHWLTGFFDAAMIVFIGHILAVILYIVLSLGIIRPPKRLPWSKSTDLI